MSHPFTDPVSGQSCSLVIPPAGRIFPSPGEPKTGVRHPGCPEVAGLSLDLDAFWCPSCGWNGRISGAWAAEMVAALKREVDERG